MADNKTKAVAGGSVGLIAIFFKMCSHEPQVLVREAEAVASKRLTSAATREVAASRAEKAFEYSERYSMRPGLSENTFEKEFQSSNMRQGLNENNFEKELRLGHRKFPNNWSVMPIVNDGIYLQGRDVLLTNKQLTLEEIKRINLNGTKFICNTGLYSKQLGITNYKVLYIYSKDVNTLKALYNINTEQAEEIINFSSPIFENSLIQSISTEVELNMELSYCKQNKITPIVIFHNNNSRLFNRPVQDYDFTNMITCNSYKLPVDAFFKTTDFIDLKYVVKSLNGSLISKPTNLATFYSDFAKEYCNCLKREKNIQTTVVLAGTTGTITGTGLIVYYNKNKS